jgi:hypothetical protein
MPFFINKKAEIEAAGHESHSQPWALASRKPPYCCYQVCILPSGTSPILHHRLKNNRKGMLPTQCSLESKDFYFNPNPR